MEGTIGEIRLFAGNFNPRSWAICNGQTLSIPQNQALFAILGTTYGGDGRTTFALPDFRGRVAIGAGQGPGLSNYDLGQRSGSPTVTLTAAQLPSHVHGQTASAGEPTQNTAQGGSLASNGRSTTPPMPNVYTTNNTPVAMNSLTGSTGNNQPLSIVQPVLGMNYIICLNGIFPPRD